MTGDEVLSLSDEDLCAEAASWLPRNRRLEICGWSDYWNPVDNMEMAWELVEQAKEHKPYPRRAIDS